MRALLKFLGSALAASLLLVSCKQEAPVPEETADYGSEREAIVAAIRSGQLAPDATGIATLPSKWGSSSMNGQVYVGKDSAGGTLVAFPLMQGSGRLQCLLFAENQLNTGAGNIQVGPCALQLSGQSQGKWHQASISTLRR